MPERRSRRRATTLATTASVRMCGSRIHADVVRGGGAHADCESGERHNPQRPNTIARTIERRWSNEAIDLMAIAVRSITRATDWLRSSGSDRLHAHHVVAARSNRGDTLRFELCDQRQPIASISASRCSLSRGPAELPSVAATNCLVRKGDATKSLCRSVPQNGRNRNARLVFRMI